MYLGARNGDRSRVGGGEQIVAAEVDSGEGVPVRDCRREVGVQLHGVTAKLARGLWWSGKGYNSGSTVS